MFVSPVKVKIYFQIRLKERAEFRVNRFLKKRSRTLTWIVYKFRKVSIVHLDVGSRGKKRQREPRISSGIDC